LKIGGNKEHIDLIKLAVNRLMEQYADKVKGINLDFERRQFSIGIKIHVDTYGYTNANFDFRPDIVAFIIKPEEDPFGKKEWKSIVDSSVWIFEAETNPRTIFHNTIKIEAYRKIKNNDYGRSTYGFILVCWDDAKLPNSVDPFDEIWKFPKGLLLLQRKKP